MRGRTLSHETLGEGALDGHGVGEVLAFVGDRPAWTKRSVAGQATDVLTFGPAELERGAFLRDELEPGRFFRLLPLVHFLREVTGTSAWRPPPTRAAFVVDDPNLHWRSYGYLKYPELVEHAHEFGYHAVMAMIPFDSWYADPSVVSLFHKNSDVLSLCFHGNNHTYRELERLQSRRDARKALAQSVRRIERFERRTRLAVSRVMVPPHEACSPESMSAMLEVGLEAACTTRPYPWMPFRPSDSPYNTPTADHVLSGWQIAELLSDGFPVIARRGFDQHEEIILRAYLDQPLVLYGHVSDFAEGLERLEGAAQVVNSMPHARWASLQDIARTNFETRRDGDVLRLRPFARHIRVPIEPDLAAIHIVKPERAAGFDYGVSLDTAGSTEGFHIDGDVIQLPGGRSDVVTIDATWNSPQAEASTRAGPSLPSARVAVRRVFTETRDRLHPVLRRRKRFARARASGSC